MLARSFIASETVETMQNIAMETKEKVQKLAQDLGGIATPEAVKMSIDALAARWETDEAAEGIGAFFDKRKAAWVTG